MFQEKDFNLDFDLLIAEVEKHPALYDGNIEAYNDRTHRHKEWLEVFKVVVPHWNTLDNNSKETLAKEIQKKWRNIRDCFVKDLKKKALHEASLTKTKWRKYIYHDQLQFLKGCLEKRKVDCLAKNAVSLQYSSTEENTNDYPTVDSLSSEPPKKTHKRNSSKDFESQLIKLLSDHKRHEANQEEDDDRYFLLSMLPSFKNLDDKTKLETRIEMLQVLRRSISACNQSTTGSLFVSFIPKVAAERPLSPLNASSSVPTSTVTTSIL